MCGGDPSRVKLDIGLKAMKPLFVIWFSAALKEMMSARNVAHNLKGWDINNMSNAFLPEHHALDSVEYCKAEKMASDGTLFANMLTGESKGGDNADAIMLDYYGRLGGNLTLTLIIQPISNPDPDCSVQRARLPQMWWIPPLQFNTRPLNGTSTETRSSAWRMPPSSPCTSHVRCYRGWCSCR